MVSAKEGIEAALSMRGIQSLGSKASVIEDNRSDAGGNGQRGSADSNNGRERPITGRLFNRASKRYGPTAVGDGNRDTSTGKGTID